MKGRKKENNVEDGQKTRKDREKRERDTDRQKKC